MERHEKHGGGAMKIVLAAAAILSIIAGSCYAQGMGRPSRPQTQNPEDEYKRKEAEEQKKKLEEAYKAAGDRIPERKEKFDPWKNAR